MIYSGACYVMSTHTSILPGYVNVRHDNYSLPLTLLSMMVSCLCSTESPPPYKPKMTGEPFHQLEQGSTAADSVANMFVIDT